MMPRFFVRSASLLLFAALASGCSVTVTSTDTCVTDSHVDCSASGTQGFSCTGLSLSPETSTRICGDPTCSNDSCAYCCYDTTVAVTVPASCSGDPKVTGCQSGSYGYSCTGSATPDSTNGNLFCSEGTANGSETDYCCLYTTSTTVGCTPDDAVASACSSVGAAYGFSCTAGSSPETSFTTLTCSAPTSTGSADTYCCNDSSTAGTTGACTADAALACVGGSTGYTCTGTATPGVANCGAPSVGPTGDTYYCCGGTTGTCTADTTITCQSGSSGVHCTGSAPPVLSGQFCSEGVADPSGGTAYCCTTPGATTTTTTTCVQDSTVACTTMGSFGFACSGTDTPTDADSSLTCSPGTAGNDGNTLYCCQ